MHIKVDDDESSKNLTQRGAYPFHTQMVLLPWPGSVSSHAGHPVHYPMASTGWDVYPSTKCMWSCWPFCQWRHPHPLHITWNLHQSSVDAPVDIHGRSHSFPLIHPREVFLAWLWVIAKPSSSCCVVLLSLPSGVCLTGVGLVYLSHTWQTPTHKGMPASDTMRRSQLWCMTHKCLCWFFTSYEGTSVTIWLGWNCHASHLWCLFSSHITLFVFEPLP